MKALIKVKRLIGTRIMSTLQKTEKNVTIRAPWGNIAVITWGESSSPPVLLCPGRLVPCSCFRPLVLRLPTSFFYVAIDLPGSGLSDHLPKGIRYTLWDLMPSVWRVYEHFKWKKFTYIGHSLGAAIGKHFNMAYPGRINRIVDLDPTPAYHTVFPEDYEAWYREIYGSHYEDKNYKIHTSGNASAPKYTYQHIKEIIAKVQNLREEAVNHVIDRYIEPAGEGLYRFTYDQRMKSTYKLPFKPEDLKQMYTRGTTPTLAILAQDSIDIGLYQYVPFAMDESAWGNGNYKYKIVEGKHDVHLDNPDCMAEDISKFLLEELKAKL